LFPRLSKHHHSAAADRRLGIVLTLAFSALLVLPFFVFAPLLLRLWTGPEYVGRSSLVLRILLVGFFFSSLAFPPFTDLQARGHSKVTAILQLAQVIPYLIVLILLTRLYGILGTASAWTVRMIVEYALMATFARRLSHVAGR
jgi:O-antigen/teichoic acid export membrane protein